MRFFTNMRVGSKLMLLVAILLTCIAATSLFDMRELYSLSKDAELLYERDLKALDAAKDANIAMLTSGRALSNITIASKENINKYREIYAEQVKIVKAELDTMETRIVDPKNMMLHQKVKEEFADLLPLERAYLDALTNRSAEENARELLKLRVTADEVNDLMASLSAAMDSEAADGSKMAADTYNRGVVVSSISLIAALLLGTIVGIATKRSLANPLVLVAGKAAQVAEGDLTQDFKLDRHDEIGKLSGALERMVVTLRQRIAEAEQKSCEANDQSCKAVAATTEAEVAKEKAEAGRQALLTAAGEVEAVVGHLSVATGELSARVEESSRGTGIQRDRVTTSATAMEEMNSTVLEVARNAGIASQGSERAREKALLGEEIVRQSVEAISEVQRNTNELKRNMESLGQKAQDIGAIMTVISDIADQTNLLALNAAIEAARAGDAGRGFAVVADEVRKLAEKTMNATHEVGSAIGGIQQGAQQSIDAVEQTTIKLDATTELVKKSGVSLAEIVDESVKTADQVRSIATAAEQQSAASEEITHSLDEINHMAGETANAMRQSAQAVAELVKQSLDLQGLVNDLRRT